MAKLAQRRPLAKFTTVRPRSGGLVHAFSQNSLDRTVCGRSAIGWIVTAESCEGSKPTRGCLTCPRCRDSK